MAATVTADDRPRVIVSTDIGGSDPDDFQSMVHLLVYADSLEVEGLISSPFGAGRKQHILDVIDCYEKDYANLVSWSGRYPKPDSLREITKQGETEVAPDAGIRRSTEGSRWIIECARRDDPRPLHLLIWGGIEDLAQALHDAPDILPKLRVHYIGGPNKKWGPHAYQYIATHHKDLWIIESNSTYRGWFNGGNQSGEWGNREFVRQHVAGHGALGELLVSKLDTMKMGDTPTVGWVLRGDPTDPTKPGWGGQFVRAWKRPYSRFDRMTTRDDSIEVFGILELTLPMDSENGDQFNAILVVENQQLAGHVTDDAMVRFRFCPKAAKAYRFEIRSNDASLNGLTGGIAAIPAKKKGHKPSEDIPNWWTDDPNPARAVAEHDGARTVSQWRIDFLKDFSSRMDRCITPHNAKLRD